MRSSEDMAYALYLADHCALQHKQSCMACLRPSKPLPWGGLAEEEQETYLRHVNALFAHLFEHGRISSYITTKQLKEARKEYAAYLVAQEQARILKATQRGSVTLHFEYEGKIYKGTAYEVEQSHG